jgi:hypothetical protein
VSAGSRRFHNLLLFPEEVVKDFNRIVESFDDPLFEDEVAVFGAAHSYLQQRLKTASHDFAGQADLVAIEIERLKLANANCWGFGLGDHVSVGGEQPDSNAQRLDFSLLRVGIILVGPGVAQRLPARQSGIDPDILVQVYMSILGSGVGRDRICSGLAVE